MKKFVVALRHGERADRHPTRRPNLIRYDPCLTEKGLIQAQQSAERLRSLIPPTSSVHIVCSPFLRTIETAVILGKLFQVPVHIDKGFGEFLLSCDFSKDPMASLKFFNSPEEVRKELDWQLIENQHLKQAQFPEDFRDGYKRVRENWARYFPTVQEETCIVVSHLYVVAALSGVWLGRDFEEFDENYCKITLARYEQGRYQVDILCDHSHATQ